MYTKKIIMLVVIPVILTLEIANTPGKLIHRVNRVALALQVIALTIVRVIPLVILALVVEPMFAPTLALMVLPFEVIGGVDNQLKT